MDTPKKGRMSRVYTSPGVKAPPEKVKEGGKATEKQGAKKHTPMKHKGR